MSTSVYQTARLFMAASRRIAWRYPAAAACTIARRSLRAKPLPLDATSRLAASRLTSHSHGPGRVSSKSVTSNISRRSAEPNRPKLDRCASPQACTASPDTAVPARSLAIGILLGLATVVVARWGGVLVRAFPRHRGRGMVPADKSSVADEAEAARSAHHRWCGWPVDHAEGSGMRFTIKGFSL